MDTPQLDSILQELKSYISENLPLSSMSDEELEEKIDQERHLLNAGECHSERLKREDRRPHA